MNDRDYHDWVCDACGGMTNSGFLLITRWDIFTHNASHHWFKRKAHIRYLRGKVVVR